MSELRVAVCELTSTDDVAANVNQMRQLLDKIEAVDLVCFPENSVYLRLQEGSAIPAVDLQSPVLQPLREWSQIRQAYVHLGSVPVQEGSRLYNASVLLHPNGQIERVYQKIHLFDVDVVGHKPMRESDTFAHGTQPLILQIKDWKIGSAICYDLRFANLFWAYAVAEVDAILIPSAFLVPTGKAHWDILVRARAIESQAYVLAAAQGGVHRGAQGTQRETYGHSLIVDPWGQVLAEAHADSRILRATLSKERLKAVRTQIPMKNHRKPWTQFDLE